MMQRPTDAAPGGMGGATRMRDPSEIEHDRVRRRVMNVAFVVIALLNTAQLRFVGVHGWRWLSVALLIVAAVPTALGVKMFELRFKMSNEERRRMLSELPAKRKLELVVYAALAIVVFGSNAILLSWALVGSWVYDFVTYYHDRPERMRHVYAVAKTLDELREFPAPWAWALPALAWAVLGKT
jgi:hypothetical protein